MSADRDPEAHLRALWAEEPTYFAPSPTFEDFQLRRQRFVDTISAVTRERIAIWLAIGRRNRWICQAKDPPFTELSFTICRDVRELADYLLRGNWCLGQAFTLDDLCFINQVGGRDEWLTLKGRTPFESITFSPHGTSREDAEQRLLELVERIRRATKEQCQRLDY